MSAVKSLRLAALPCLVGLPAAAAPALPDTALPDTFLARVEALASMETLNADVLSSRSATKALETWCASHGLAQPAKIRAEAVKGADTPITAEQRRRLQIGPDEPVKYRRVRLTCGIHVLSEADNWYVPSRLTPEMNRVLETTDTPFGKAVAALGFTRETFAAEVLWHVLASGWETRPPPADHPDRTIPVPPILFEHRALLFDRVHRPFSEVDEHYTRDNLVVRRDK